MSSQARGVRRTSAVMVMLWMRSDLSREESMAYWRGPHSQLVARTPGFLEYRQHHFPAGAKGMWPAIDGVETEIPDDRRIDGTPEVVFENPVSNLKALNHNKVVFDDEKNVFARTVLNMTMPLGGRWFDTADAGPVGCRAVVLLRRRDGAPGSDVSHVVHDGIGATLAGLPGITEVRTQVYAPYLGFVWNTPSVAHDYPIDKRFHANIVIGARDETALREALSDERIAALTPGLARTFTAIHAYPVTATYTYRRDGRPTLPAHEPVTKPRLDPVLRRVAAAPTPQDPSQPLPSGRVIPLLGGAGEDVISDGQGRLLCGVESGAIVRYDPKPETFKIVADTGGRPLGLELLPDGRVLVCDAHRGLLRVDPESGAVETVVQYIDDVPLRFCSNAAAQKDGTIWFTESSTRFDFDHYLGELLEHRGSGKLLRRDPDGTVETVLSGLYFINGVTLTPDESAVLFTETGDYSLSRVALTGPRQGHRERVLENLPGFPDNLSRFDDGKAWFPLTNPRNKVLNRLAGSPALLRKLLWRLPERLTPQPDTWIRAIAIDTAGAIVDEVHGHRDDFDTAMGVVELDGRIYLTSTHHAGILELDR